MLATLKDLAVEMQLSVRCTRKWLKRLGKGAKPDRCARNGCYRWSAKGKARFLELWKNYNAARGRRAENVAALFKGELRDQNQIFFIFDGKKTYQKTNGQDARATKAKAASAVQGHGRDTGRGAKVPVGAKQRRG